MGTPVGEVLGRPAVVTRVREMVVPVAHRKDLRGEVVVSELRAEVVPVASGVAVVDHRLVVVAVVGTGVEADPLRHRVDLIGAELRWWRM